MKKQPELCADYNRRECQYNSSYFCECYFQLAISYRVKSGVFTKKGFQGIPAKIKDNKRGLK